MLEKTNNKDVLDDDSLISQKIKNGLVFTREEVGGKVRYSYSLYLDVNPTDETILKDISYARDQLENVIISKKVQDKVAYFKALELDE